MYKAQCLQVSVKFFPVHPAKFTAQTVTWNQVPGQRPCSAEETHTLFTNQRYKPLFHNVVIIHFLVRHGRRTQCKTLSRLRAGRLPGRSKAVLTPGRHVRGLAGTMDQRHQYRPTPSLLRATSFFGAVSPHFMPNFHQRLPVLPDEFMTISNIPSVEKKNKGGPTFKQYDIQMEISTMRISG